MHPDSTLRLVETVVMVWKTGNILDSDAEALVNPVNCVGVMGKGLALAYAQKWPDMFKRYERYCEAQKLRLGRPVIDRHQRPWIVNFPTKNHWRHKSNPEWIGAGLKRLQTMVALYGIRSIAIPALGCGEGGLPWSHVAPALTMFAKSQPIPVHLYAPRPSPGYR